MSIIEAYENLSKTLGDDFKYKNKRADFDRDMMSTRARLSQLTGLISKHFPDATCLEYNVYWDDLNRLTKIGDYEISNESGVIIDFEGLRDKDFKLFETITQAVKADNEQGLIDSVWPDDEEGVMCRFHFDTLIVEELDKEEDEEEDEEND